MGQALRRATGRIRSSSIEPSPSSQIKSVDRRPPAVPVEPTTKSEDSGSDGQSESESISTTKMENVLEERDPGYDAMLSQMVGRISTKPGGKLEMGEAFVVEKYNRPMPKVRNTGPDSGRFEEKPVPPGTLNVAQLRQILLLHQGKSNEHDGPLDAHRIAEKFRVDVVQVRRILDFLSLPPEDNSKHKDEP